MGKQIIKQPLGSLGEYAVFSSMVNDFIYINCTKEEIINFFIEEATKEITRGVNEKIDALEKGEKPYYQFTKTWEEALKIIKSIHSQKHVSELLEDIDSRKEKGIDNNR